MEKEQNKKVPVKPPKDNGGKYFESLLPEKGYIRIRDDQNQKNAQKPRIGDTSIISSTTNKSALDKLAKFFKRRESKKDVTKKTKSKTSNKMIQLINLKRTAKGDSSIPLDNRIYVYCLVLDSDNDDSNEHQIYINKVWPVGRALDYIAKQLNVPNQNNNFKIDSDQKLNLYRKDDQTGAIKYLLSANRVSTDIKDLDSLYLVRGNSDPESLSLV